VGTMIRMIFGGAEGPPLPSASPPKSAMTDGVEKIILNHGFGGEKSLALRDP
jgi:hypothetical protein